VRTFGYYRPVLWLKSADNYLYNGLLKHQNETWHGCKQNWQLAALFYVQRRLWCKWALSFHNAVNSLSGGRLAKIGLDGRFRRRRLWSCSRFLFPNVSRLRGWHHGWAWPPVSPVVYHRWTWALGRGSSQLSDTSTACTADHGMPVVHCCITACASHVSLMVVCICKPVI